MMKDFERIDQLIKDKESLEKAILDEFFRLEKVMKNCNTTTTKLIIGILAGSYGRILAQNRKINTKEILDDKLNKLFNDNLITTNNMEGNAE